MKIDFIDDTIGHYVVVSFPKTKIAKRVVVSIGIAKNGTLAVSENQEGDQINIPFRFLGCEVPKERKIKKDK